MSENSVDLDQDTVIIVSGLPRSGTSLMMQLLEAGGVPVLSDRVRRADDDNPKGYYEFEPVKKTREDASWLADARGKVVKMVYLLLYDLPEDHNYRVIFMDRKLDEVVASQNIMLERHGKADGTIDDATTVRLFEKQLSDVREWLESKSNFEVLYVRHGDLFADNASQIEAIRDFLGANLNTEAMATVVDPSLYRNRR